MYLKICYRQCSECEDTNFSSEKQVVDTNAPRKSRYSGIERSIPCSRRSSSFVNEVKIELF